MKSFVLGGLGALAVWFFIIGGGQERFRSAVAGYEQRNVEETIERLKAEREQAFLQSYRTPRDCAGNITELKRLECGNRMDMARAGFYAKWNEANKNRFN